MLLILTRLAALSTANEDEIDRIPLEFRGERLDRLRCYGDRCSALLGEVGVLTTCAVYDVRPDDLTFAERALLAMKPARSHASR